MGGIVVGQNLLTWGLESECCLMIGDFYNCFVFANVGSNYGFKIGKFMLVFTCRFLFLNIYYYRKYS